MNEEETNKLNAYIEDFYQAMQIGNMTLESKHSEELYDLITKLQQENENLKQQLKEKDEKISKAIEYINTKELPDYGIFPLDDDDYRKDILEILESNKED